MFFVSLFLCLSILSFLRFSVSFANAQTTACDLCGVCEGNPAIPNDYLRCTQCLYTNPAVVDDSTQPPTIVTKPGGPKDEISWTVIGCLPTTPAAFTQKIVQFVTAIIGGIAFLSFLYGGFIVLTSSGDPERLTSGKKIISSAILALLIILFAVFLFRFVGITILKIPGIG